jgi:hypothetical protein
MLYRFEIAGHRVPLYRRVGESFEHVMLKALCYGLFVDRYEGLEIERRLGGRYTPDVVALGEDGRVRFWGECGTVSMRKSAWLAKHSGAEALAFVKLGVGPAFVAELRRAIEERYRPAGRIVLYSFDPQTRDRVEALSLHFDAVPREWYRRMEV